MLLFIRDIYIDYLSQVARLLYFRIFTLLFNYLLRKLTTRIVSFLVKIIDYFAQAFFIYFFITF